MPLVYISNAAALALIGPGRYSLDKVLGIKIPAVLGVLTAAGVIAGIAVAHLTREQLAQEQPPAADTQAEQNSAKGESVEEFKAREAGADMR